jgi:hypothetical protein
LRLTQDFQAFGVNFAQTCCLRIGSGGQSKKRQYDEGKEPAEPHTLIVSETR